MNWTETTGKQTIDMEKEKKTYEGKVIRDVFGSWDDCSPGLYVDHDMVETIVNEFSGRRIRLTIEVIPEPDNSED